MEGGRQPGSMQKCLYLSKSGVTFAASLTHAAQPLIRSEWLDLSRKWDGGGRRKSGERAERERERGGGEKEPSYSCSVGSAL